MNCMNVIVVAYCLMTASWNTGSLLRAVNIIWIFKMYHSDTFETCQYDTDYEWIVNPHMLRLFKAEISHEVATRNAVFPVACGLGWRAAGGNIQKQRMSWIVALEHSLSANRSLANHSRIMSQQALARENCTWQWQPRHARPVIKAQRTVLVQRKSNLSLCDTYSGFLVAGFCRKFEDGYQAQEQHHRVWIDAFKHADNELLRFISLMGYPYETGLNMCLWSAPQ